MRMLVAMAVFLVTSAAAATELQSSPNKSSRVTTGEQIKEASEVSKRLIDAPVVRSSKGCIGFLGETKSGAIFVQHLLGKNGKPICRAEYAYRPGSANDLK